ncbi:hypothetical protein ACQKB4_16725 [Mycobacterium tuberculosis]
MSVPPSWPRPSTPVSALSGAGLTTLDGTDVAEHGTPAWPGCQQGQTSEPRVSSPDTGPAHGDVVPAGGWVTRLPLSLSSCRRANPGHH